MRVALTSVLTSALFCTFPLLADTAWYQPTPYDISIVTGQHIWDGWITSVYYGKVLLRDDKLQVGGYGDEYRSYLKFDTTGLPKTVTRAVLNVMPYARGDGSTPVSAKISKVTSSWTSSLTWDLQPPAALIANLPAPTAGQWWTATITDTFNAWQSGTNYGVVIAPLANANDFDVLRSSRFGDDSQRPALRLDFTPPVPTPAFKMPLPGGVSWLVTTEAGGYDCTGKGLQPDTAHTDLNYFSIDFSWRNKDPNGNQTYSNPASGGSIPILAAAAGKIAKTSVTDPIPDNGNYVVIDHDGDGNLATGFSTRYLHMRDVPMVTVGQSVQQGDQLGWMGSTGNSTAPHLHFGVRYDDDGSSARAEVTYVTVDGWLLKSFQTECSSSGDYIRYYQSSNRVFQPPSSTTTPVVPSDGIVNAASFAKGQAVSPGSLVSIFGTGLGSTSASASSIPLPTQLANASVTFNGIPASLFNVVPQSGFVQINAQVPWNVLPAGATNGTVTVVATNNGVSSTPTAVPVNAFSPGIFAINAQGFGQAAVQIFPDFALAAPMGSVPGVNSRPATVGDILVFYATGVGPVDQQVANGDVPRVLTQFSPPITVLIGGVPTAPQFAGLSGSFVALNQINVVVPAGVPTGTSVPLQIQSGGITTTDKITIAIQGSQTQLTLQSMTVSPTSVTGGQSATGTITLSGTAPSGGVDVQVSLGTQAPVAIRVAAGQTSATFQINTVAVTSSTTLTITATLNGTQRTATLTVLPVTLQSVTVNPTSVTGGQSVTGTITLSGSAPSGGVDVLVSLGTQAPVAIRVAAGQTSATFQINTVAVTSSTTLTITATLNGIQRTATLTVLPGASSNAFHDYWITMTGTMTLAGKTIPTTIISSVPGSIPEAVVDTTANMSSGIVVYCYFFNPTLSGNTVTFTATNGQGMYTNTSGGGTGIITSGTLSLTATSPSVGTSVSGTLQFSTAGGSFNATFTGKIISSVQ